MHGRNAATEKSFCGGAASTSASLRKPARTGVASHDRPQRCERDLSCASPSSRGAHRAAPASTARVMALSAAATSRSGNGVEAQPQSQARGTHGQRRRSLRGLPGEMERMVDCGRE